MGPAAVKVGPAGSTAVKAQVSKAREELKTGCSKQVTLITSLSSAMNQKWTLAEPARGRRAGKLLPHGGLPPHPETCSWNKSPIKVSLANQATLEQLLSKGRAGHSHIPEKLLATFPRVPVTSMASNTEQSFRQRPRPLLSTTVCYSWDRRGCHLLEGG